MNGKGRGCCIDLTWVTVERKRGNETGAGQEMTVTPVQSRGTCECEGSTQIKAGANVGGHTGHDGPGTLTSEGFIFVCLVHFNATQTHTDAC